MADTRIIVPQPKIDVSIEPNVDSGQQKVNVTFTREDKSKSYTSEKCVVSEAVKDVFEQVFSDPHSAEYVKPK